MSDFWARVLKREGLSPGRACSKPAVDKPLGLRFSLWVLGLPFHRLLQGFGPALCSLVPECMPGRYAATRLQQKFTSMPSQILLSQSQNIRRGQHCMLEQQRSDRDLNNPVAVTGLVSLTATLTVRTLQHGYPTFIVASADSNTEDTLPIMSTRRTRCASSSKLKSQGPGSCRPKP